MESVLLFQEESLCLTLSTRWLNWSWLFLLCKIVNPSSWRIIKFSTEVLPWTKLVCRDPTTNNIRHNMFQPVGYQLCRHFIDYIAKCNRSKMGDRWRLVSLRNNSHAPVDRSHPELGVCWPRKQSKACTDKLKSDVLYKKNCQHI